MIRRAIYGLLFLLSAVTLLTGSLGVSAALAETPTGSGQPEYEVVVGVQGPGDNGMIEIYDRDGTRTWARADAHSYHDVVPLDQHRLAAAFADGSTDCEPYPSPCGRTGFRVFNVTTDELEWEWSIPVRTLGNSEVHDIEQLDEGRFLVADMDGERLLTVSESGGIEWQWNASGFYSPPADVTRTDWLHINDVDVVSPGRYLISVRNSNQLLVIERGAGVVEVINEDLEDGDDGSCLRDGYLVDEGDVRCGDPDLLRHQHNPQWLGDGAVLVADSENQRAVELHRSENGTWEANWSVAEIGDEALHWPRDADRLPNGRTLVTDSRNNRIAAVDEHGELVWQVRTAALPYEADAWVPGEPAAGETYHSQNATAGQVDSSLPIIGDLYVAMLHLYAVPHWVSEWHVLVGLVALGQFYVGGYLLLSTLWNAGGTRPKRTA